MAAERLHARGGAAGIDVRDLVPVWGDFNEDLRRLGPGILQTHLGDQLAPADVLRFLGPEDSARAAEPFDCRSSMRIFSAAPMRAKP
jgi:hypothetical protein